MLKFVLIGMIVIFLSACGVETSSSPLETTSVVVITDPDVTDPDVTDPDVTDPDTTDPVTDPGTGINSSFDTTNAIEDPNACTTSGYRTASDASYGGSLVGENGSDGFVIADSGLVIRSEHLSQDNPSTWVTLFYKGFPSPDDLNNQGVTSYLMGGVFYLSYDIAWSDESIVGIDNRMYVQSDKDEKPVCYRLDLNNISGSLIDIQKVYRVSL